MGCSKSEEEDDSSDETKMACTSPRTLSSSEELNNDSRCIAFESSLIQLVKFAPRTLCPIKGCAGKYEINASKIGTALYLTWVHSLSVMQSDNLLGIFFSFLITSITALLITL